MQKKSLAILLSLLLIVTSFWTMFTFTTAASSLNLIQNGDFEQALTTDNIYPQGIAAGSEQTQMAANVGKWGRIRSGVTRMEHTPVTAQNGSAINGNYFLTSGATQDSNGYIRTFGQFVYLEAGDYTLSFIYKNDTANRFRAGVYTIGCETTEANAAYAVKTGFLPVQSAWTEHTITFTITEAKYYMVGFGSNINPSSGTFSIDNVTLIKTVNLIKNGDFASQTMNDFEFAKAADGYTIENRGTAETPDYYLSGVAGEAVYQKVTVESGVQYTVSFDFRFNGTINNEGFARAGFMTAKGDLTGGNFQAVTGLLAEFTGGYYTIPTKHRVDKTDWYTHTFTFDSSISGDIYAVIGTYSGTTGDGFSLDNWRMAKTSDYVTVTTVADGNGTVTAGGKALPGDKLILTAKAEAGSVFKGWYLDGATTPVSTDETYVHTVTAAASLVAKFELNTTGEFVNYIKNGDFETEETFEKISDANASQDVMAANAGKWGRVASGVTRMDQTPVTAENGTAANGQYFLTSGATSDSNAYIRSFGQFVYLPAGDYVLSFMGKSNYDKFYFCVYDRPDVPIITPYTAMGAFKVTSDWTNYSLKFTVTNGQYYEIAFGGSENGNAGKEFAIDNVVLCKASDYITVTAVTDGGGTVTHPTGIQKIGDNATVTATPNSGYVFQGWYVGNDCVSTDATYTFEVTKEVELEARFVSESEAGKIVLNGTFEEGTTDRWQVVQTAAGSSISVVDDAERQSKVLRIENAAYALYQKVNLEKGTEYIISFDAKFDDPSAVPDRVISFYRMGFVKDPAGGLSGSNFIGPKEDSLYPNQYYSIFNNLPKDNMDGWNSYSSNYTATKDGAIWFAIGCFNTDVVSGWSIDNIAITPKDRAVMFKAVAVSASGSGKVTSSQSGVVAPNSNVRVTATANPGSKFDGWYLNGTKLSDAETYTYTVVNSVNIYARFVDATNPDANQLLDNSDFATGDLTGWGLNNVSYSDPDIVYAKVDGKDIALVGESGMLYQTVALEPFTTYVARVTSRIPDFDKITEGNMRNFYRLGLSKLEAPNVLQSGSLSESAYTHTYLSYLDTSIQGSTAAKYVATKDWRTYTYTYTNNSPDVMLVNVVAGAPYCNKADLQIQKFEFYAYANGVVEWEPEALYGEAFYNAVSNSGFEKATTDADWGKTLPTGWSIQKGHTETGNKYLSVSGNKSKTYQIPVDGAATYLVSFSLRTAKKGSASISVVDANGAPLSDSFGTNDNLAIFQPTADNTWQRIGAQIFVENDGTNQPYVYLKISGGTNTLDIDDVMISTVGYNNHETFVDFTVPEYDYDNPVYYDPTVMYATDAKPDVEGTVADGESMSNGTENNADTGDDLGALLPILLIGILLPCAVCLGFMPKRTKENEKEVVIHE